MGECRLFVIPKYSTGRLCLDFVTGYCCNNLLLYHDVILYKVGVFGGGTASFGPMLANFFPKHGLAVWFERMIAYA